MTREEMDAFDRRIAGITAPGAYGEGMAALDRAVGNPVASYSLDDLRRMFLRGQAPAATPGAMPAAVEAMIPAAPTDALRGPAMPGPVAAAPLPPPPAPAPPAMPSGTRPTAPVMPPPPAPAVMAGQGMGPETQADQRMFTVPTQAELSGNAARAQALAAALRRAPPTSADFSQSATPFEAQIMPESLRGMPVEAQADQRMASVSRINPQSFGQRFRRTIRGE